ncbi:MAG: oxidoreductase [Rhodothermales bacterium]|nr:oxidoreductase [Rhodothermales bacterium]MBO6781265.1 oxidoreductase [Rhodothermales bacterium]
MVTALFIEEKGKNPAVNLREVPLDSLPEGDLDVEVLWSSLNYKDALALTGRSPIVRAPFPFVPGIDLAGRVLASRSPTFAPGDMVLQTGWGLGENRWGGYAGRACLRSEHVVPLPEGMSAREAMIVGTAGFTAMLACMAIQAHGVADGPIAVTGASGGVGSISVALLARLGHEVVASTGSGDPGYLQELGASRIIGRDDLASGAHRALDSGRWGGAVDSVGGSTLEALISQTMTRGAIAACGLAGGHELNTTVFPFILRGVGLLGIDSNTCPDALRREAWSRLRDLMDGELYALLAAETDLAGVHGEAVALLGGKKRGRTVVRCA